MARAYPQPQFDNERSPSEWQSLRQELVELLNQVDSQVGPSRAPAPPRYAEPAREPRYFPEDSNDNRQREALKSVQRAITRFDHTEPMPSPQQMPPNPRDSLQAAINQIRSRQDERRAASAPQQQYMPQPAPTPTRQAEAPLFDKLAQSVNGLSGRLERLEGEIKAQIKTGANVKDVADQVAQLAHVVELLAGAVGETGQVKRLEGQIASLGKIMSQGREMDIQALTRRLDDVASTVGKLAELQVHFADKVQNPVDTQSFQNGMQSIEQSVRSVYDRIDALERQRSLSPNDLDHVTGEMARFTEVLRTNMAPPQHLVELVDALNTRISDIESGDRLLHGLRKDLTALRDAVTMSLAPRFDAIEQKIETLGSAMSTQADMAEIARQIGTLGDRIGERPIDPGIGQLEAQVRQLVARMDQTGEQLSGLAKLYSSEPAGMVMPDFEAVADMVAERTAEAVQRNAPAPDHSVALSLEGLESRITAMLRSMQHEPEVDGFDEMQDKIGEVNERLKRLEQSLTERSSQSYAPQPMVRQSDIEAIIADADVRMPAPRQRADAMGRSPLDEAPLMAPAFPEPAGPVADALDARNGGRRPQHPGLGEDVPLAARHEARPMGPSAPAGFEPEKIATPPAPQPSSGFFETKPMMAEPSVGGEAVSSSSRNTFIEAARRAAQRTAPAKAEVNSNSLIGRALSRFQSDGEAKPVAEKPARKLAGDKPARTEFKPEPVMAPPAAAASLEPQVGIDTGKPTTEVKDSFLTRNRRAILLGALVVAVGLLAANLVAQRLMAPAPEAAPASAAPVLAAPQTTGDIAGDTNLSSDPAPADSELIAPSMPPRVIPMTDTLNTGSIDKSAAQGFTTAPQAMPSAFQAATDLANADPATAALPEVSSVEPLTATASEPDATASTEPEASPVKVELPPDNVGPMDLRQAAADGDARAQFEVAAIYTEGRAVPQDYKAAATWYERAAASGFAPAQYRLGSLYENGNGVTKDLNTARLWYERAAEAGNRMSMHNLAALYAGGQLGKQQFDAASKWFEEAADRGLTDSQFNLGMLYARGLGVPQDMKSSYKWFAIAALSGDKDSAKARDDIARSLDADAIKSLQADVAAFKPKPIDLAANFAPIGTWSKTFDPGETIATKDIVTNVQKALGKLGYDIGTPDGVAGKKTADAIKSFEGATGMSQVGLINPRLLAVLGSQPV
jgi:localization factor PodJL